MIGAREAKTKLEFAREYLDDAVLAFVTREPNADDTAKLREAAARLNALADEITPEAPPGADALAPGADVIAPGADVIVTDADALANEVDPAK